MMITDSLFCYKELMSTKTHVLLAHTTSPPFSQDTQIGKDVFNYINAKLSH